MTQDETRRILGILKKGWPGYYRQMDRKEAEGVVELWSALLIDFPVELVARAVERYLVQDTKGFPPSIGQIVASINAIQHPPVEELTEAEAWYKVRRALANGFYHSAEEYAKLPPTLQKVVGSPERLHDWAMMDSELVETNVRPMICRSYTAQVEREREQLALPPTLARQIASMAERQAIAAPEEMRLPEPEPPAPQTESRGYRMFMEALKGFAQEKTLEPGYDDIRDDDAEAHRKLEAQYQMLTAGGAG